MQIDKFWLTAKIYTNLFYSFTEAKFVVSVWNITTLSLPPSPSVVSVAFSNCMKKQYCTKILYEACASKILLILVKISFPELHPDTLFSMGNKGQISASLMLIIHTLGNTQGNVKLNNLRVMTQNRLKSLFQMKGNHFIYQSIFYQSQKLF